MCNIVKLSPSSSPSWAKLDLFSLDPATPTNLGKSPAKPNWIQSWPNLKEMLSGLITTARTSKYSFTKPQPSFTWAWHCSAPACFLIILVHYSLIHSFIILRNTVWHIFWCSYYRVLVPILLFRNCKTKWAEIRNNRVRWYEVLGNKQISRGEMNHNKESYCRDFFFLSQHEYHILDEQPQIWKVRKWQDFGGVTLYYDYVF